MRTKFIPVLFLLSFCFAYAQQPLTPFEKNKLTTTTYEECIAFYKELAEQSDRIKVLEYGESDIGQPVHLVVVSKDGIFDPQEIHKSGKVVLFVNNGIHPGEPDGVDACMMLVRDLLFPPLLRRGGQGGEALLDHVVLITIPIYNIGGAMNRNN